MYALFSYKLNFCTQVRCTKIKSTKILGLHTIYGKKNHFGGEPGMGCFMVLTVKRKFSYELYFCTLCFRTFELHTLSSGYCFFIIIKLNFVTEICHFQTKTQLNNTITYITLFVLVMSIMNSYQSLKTLSNNKNTLGTLLRNPNSARAPLLPFY